MNSNLRCFKPLFAVALCLFLSFNTFSQKKYPSLLWEITGNGLTKPSYLYGTMHVSSKLAYHLSDSFFVALNNVNTIGLESNPDQWLKSMKDMGMLEQFNNPNTYANADFYKDAFKVEPPANKRYVEILATDADIINNLLYRNNSYKDEHEESTYIDLFIYKAGSKLNKKVVSLEDFKTSLIMATKGSVNDPNETYDESKSKVDYIKVQSLINDAYRSGDLDAIDSLTKLTYTTKNTQKYLIEDRNTILAHNIDSVSKTGSIFAGIGAAHLPGKNGVIEMLRKMGYTLRPVSGIATKKGNKLKENIEAIVKKLPANKYYSTDSLFTYDVYESPVNIVNLKGYSYFLTADMTNGSYYTIARQTTYAPLINYDINKMMLKIDSLLYESIPGKITSKKEITSNTGLKGFDIINKTKKGDQQRYQIFFPENEVIIFKMSGKGEYVKGPEGMRFFESIKFMPKKTDKNFTFSPKTKGFSVSVPEVYKYNNNKKGGDQGLAEELFAFDANTKTTTGVMHYIFQDYNYLEEDTFELNLLCSSTLKNFNYTVNNKREFLREQNLSCINFSGENIGLNKTFYGKIFIKGSHYYLAYGIVDNTANSKKPDEFFNSFKIIDFKHINQFKTITDHNYAFTVTDEMVPEDINQLDDGMKDFYAEIQKIKDSKLISSSYDFKSKSKSYYSPSSGEHVNIDYIKYNDYDYRDPKTYWDDLKKFIKTNNTFIISNPVVTKLGKTETMDVVLKDTATASIIKRKYILKDGLLFCLSATCDSTIGTTGWTDGFLKTFKHKDTVFTKPIFEDKIETLLKDLNSADTTVKYAAVQTLNDIAIDKKFAKHVIDYLQTPEFLKLDENAKATLLVNAGNLNDEKVIQVYKNLYNYYEDSSYMQICIIKGLGYLKTKNSYNTIYELLKNKTPLTGSEENITNILTPLYDSLELCTNYFPGLFTLSSFEEYKTPIYKLFTDLVIRGLIPPAKYQPNLPMLLTEASNELKRYNTSTKSGNTNQNYYDEMEEANRIAEYYASTYNEPDSVNRKKTYPTYSNMIENYAVIMAPFYATNLGVKQYFDKLFKIKNESALLNVYLIANKNKVAVNDTVWKFFSKSNKTKFKTYNELRKLNLESKLDNTKLSQEEFCKTLIENDIFYGENFDGEDNSNLKQKVKPDSVFFLKKVAVKNNREEGDIYFFDRVDSKTKVKSLAYTFVKKQKDGKITTQIELLSSKKVIVLNKTTDETISEICSDFYYRNRLRYQVENNNSYLNNLYNEE